MAKAEKQTKSSKTSTIVFKVLTIVISIPVGRLVTKAIDRIWIAVRPNTPTASEEAAEVDWRDAVAWAALSAAGFAAAQLITKRGAETAYRAIIGTPPPPVATVAERRFADRLEEAEKANKKDAKKAKSSA